MQAAFSLHPRWSDIGSHSASNIVPVMQTSIPVFSGIQCCPPPFGALRQPPYQPLYEPGTRPDAPSVDYPTATQGAESVHGLPQPQESPTKAPSSKTVPNGLPKLLPASAKYSVATSTPIVVSYLEDTCLARLLKRLKKIRRREEKVTEHRTILADLLGGAEAIWDLASMMLPATPDIGLPEHSDLSDGASTRGQVIHIEGMVLYVDLVESQEVCFKLTDETIEALLDYHDSIHCVTLRANHINDNEIDGKMQVAKDAFFRAIHAFTFRTGKRCLLAIQANGSGELDLQRPMQVKSKIMALFKPLPEMATSST